MIEMDYLELTSIVLISAFLAVLLIKAYFTFSFFSKQNIAHYGPVQSLKAFSKSMPLGLWEIHKKSGNNKIFGFFLFWRPAILIKDVDMIKQVLVKQFSKFHDRGLYINEEKEPLSGHLFALEGEKWRNLRHKLSPVFAAGKIKGVFQIATKYAETLVNCIQDHPEEDFTECYDLMAKYTLSIISSFAFGIESNSFDSNSKFTKMAQRLFGPSYETLVRTFVLFQLRDFAKYYPFIVIPRDASNYFLQLAKDLVNIREKSNFERSDFLEMLIQLKNKGSMDNSTENDGIRLTVNQVAAQMYLFVVGGFETSAMAQSWALYELALNPDIQRRLQAEVDSVSDWTLENINSLEYLDMVLNETLRMYPPFPFLPRRCNKDTLLEGSDVVIKEGMDVNISLLGLHRDPALFPNPNVFDPERFGPNAKHQIQPYSYLPFGEGPRICLGLRTGKIEFKTGIATLMKHFNVETTAKTTIPPVFNPKALAILPKDGIWLTFSKRGI